MTYTRLRPFGLDPSYYVDGANDRTYNYIQDRVSASFTTRRRHGPPKRRFGSTGVTWTAGSVSHAKDPSDAPETVPWDRSLPRISISGPPALASDAAEIWDMNGTTYTVEQKISHYMGKHTTEVRRPLWFTTGASAAIPRIPNFSFQSKADFLANVPSSVVRRLSAPRPSIHACTTSASSSRTTGGPPRD